MAESLRGRLLVATPTLIDPNFHLTVIFVLQHDDEDGAVGVVVNRPSDVAVMTALPPWAALADAPPVVFLGGPVNHGAAIALARRRSGASPAGWEPVLDEVGVVDLSGDPDAVHPDLQDLRVFTGYAGWGPGQLEDEIAAGSWFVVEADPSDPFADEPAALWRRVLTRQGGVFRTVTDDPSRN
ncbi:MAG: YqgE/AlgH family protein [Actinobacteria bacterium]|nr:YqgE/AlgH family protein [Actinomycetota bacterium]